MGSKMGGSFKREGTKLYLWLVHVDVLQKTTKFCKAFILQLKNKYLLKTIFRSMTPSMLRACSSVAATMTGGMAKRRRAGKLL